MRNVEFVSYDGEYPNLCSGNLVLKIDGVDYKMPRYCLVSGGSIWIDEEDIEHISEDEWRVNVPPELEKYSQEIQQVVNENIPFGCCGGCI